jgi:hypothetical protein
MTGQRHITGVATPDGSFAEPIVSFRLADGVEVHRPFRQVSISLAMDAAPWRTARSARGQTHYPGYYWSATTGTHVIYESRLELARLLLADFDPMVAAIIAQPFRLKACVGDQVRRHVPDFLLVGADRSATVVNVKPASKLADPEVAAALAWPGKLIDTHGWRYEIWSGEDPLYLANVRFLAGYRRSGLIPEDLLDVVLAAAMGSGQRFASLVAALGTAAPVVDVKAAALRLLWQRRLCTDLRQRLDDTSVLRVAS